MRRIAGPRAADPPPLRPDRLDSVMGPDEVQRASMQQVEAAAAWAVSPGASEAAESPRGSLFRLWGIDGTTPIRDVANILPIYRRSYANGDHEAKLPLRLRRAWRGSLGEHAAVVVASRTTPLWFQMHE